MRSLRRGGVSSGALAFSAVMAVASVVLSTVPAVGQSQSDTTTSALPAVERSSPLALPSRNAAEPTPTSTVPRGNNARGRGVPVRNVSVSDNGAVVTAMVFWNQQMIARKGSRDRFNARLVALDNGGAASSIVLKSLSTTKRAPAVQEVTMRLTKASAKKLRASSNVVLAVSQQYGRAGRHRNKYFRQYVTVTRIKPAPRTFATESLDNRSSALPTTPRAARDCSRIEIKPGADLHYCNLSRANLSGSDLSGVNLTGATLTGAVLTACNLDSAELAGADLAGAVFGGISGTPMSLPDSWTLINSDIVYMEPISL